MTVGISEACAGFGRMQVNEAIMNSLDEAAHFWEKTKQANAPDSERVNRRALPHSEAFQKKFCDFALMPPFSVWSRPNLPRSPSTRMVQFNGSFI